MCLYFCLSVLLQDPFGCSKVKPDAFLLGGRFSGPSAPSADAPDGRLSEIRELRAAGRVFQAVDHRGMARGRRRLLGSLARKLPSFIARLSEKESTPQKTLQFSKA